jgi:hypothetical protein
VQKRFARGWFDEAGARERVAGLLRTRAVRDGWELTLLDCDADKELALRSVCQTLGEPAVPTLEDLFLDMTAENARERESQGAA